MASKPAVLRLVAREYAFEAPERVPAGAVAIRLVNRGTEPHYARLLRLEEGKTAGDYMAARRQGDRAPAWAVPAGGPAPVMPGDSAELTRVLAPGRYVVLCGYPAPDRMQHLDRGMVREVEVVASSAEPAPLPEARLRLTLADSAFRISAPPAAGWQRVLVENPGRAMHQALIVHLPKGVTLEDEERWFAEGFRTPRPGHPSGGVLELRPGERVVIALELRPGRYAILCHAADREGGPHAARPGEQVELVVR